MQKNPMKYFKNKIISKFYTTMFIYLSSRHKNENPKALCELSLNMSLPEM